MIQKSRKTLGRFEISDVLPYVTRERTRRLYEVSGQTYRVRMDSLRYHTFLKGLDCVNCKVVGAYFLLEQYEDVAESTAHFNLYADVNGETILFTKDHIVPISKGGSDHINNLQTMCFRCNESKGNGKL